MKIFAFIDSQNLNLSIINSGWKLDFARFRVYLKEKYKVEKAFVFIGFISDNQSLYKKLQEMGYILIFKPTIMFPGGIVKGNIDAELVLHAMIEYENYEKAIIISGDGDFYCLINYLIENQKLEAVLIPNRFKFSALLKIKKFSKFLRYMNDLRNKIGYKKEKSP